MIVRQVSFCLHLNAIIINRSAADSASALGRSPGPARFLPPLAISLLTTQITAQAALSLSLPPSHPSVRSHALLSVTPY